MTLPFTPEVFFSIFEHYNHAIWPAQIIAYVMGIACLLLTVFPSVWSDRAISAVLAVAWLWMGIVYHFMYFAEINFAAPAFGLLFIFQGLIFAWTGLIRGTVAFRFKGDVFGWVGLGAAAVAMAVYPVIGWLAGHGWPRAPMFGVAPCPTTIFTMGVLLLTAGRTPLHLAIIPVIWSLIGGTAAWLLGVAEDFILLLAGIGGLALIVWKNRRAKTKAS